MRVSILVALVGLTLLGLALCDTPASCMTDQVLGEWVFSMARAGDSVPTSDQMDCSAFQTRETYKVVLMSPNLAFDTDGLGGTWTMIYNQGFEVTIGGRKLFHFFKWAENDDESVTSYCGESMPGMGWAHKASIPPTRWQCYSAEKAVPVPPTTQAVETHPLSESPMPRPFAHVSGPVTDRYLEGESSWYAIEHPKWHNLPHSTIQRMGGSVRAPVERMGDDSKVWSHPTALVEDSMFGSETYQHRVGAVLTDDLPTNWDWRDIDGVDYVTAVRDQGRCGSCFSFSTTGAMASRLRIATDNAKTTEFAPQHVVSCSQYSQSCDGGFEHLVVKFSEDYGILPADSFPYTSGVDGTVSSCEDQLDGDRYTFTRYEYLGGYYGASNEALMMQELYLNGPMPISYEVYDDFYDYAGGVYQHNTDELTTSFFEATSHSVLLVGYGFDEEEQLPFWTIQNSWASDWGEDGYFRIIRGVDNCAVESGPVRFFWQP